MRALLGICLTISGGAALSLEMLWLRSAHLALGATAGTTAAVVALVFAGLGFGALLARAAAPNPVRRYGILELGAACGALWSLAAFRLLSSGAAQRWLEIGGAAASLAGLAAAILPATVCLGATLPALAPALVEASAAGARGGILYALNTAGGAIGIAVAGFGMPALFGVMLSYLVAAAASALAGSVALGLSSRAFAAQPRNGSRARSDSPARPAISAISHGRLRVAAAGLGALGLGLEILWSSLFAQVLHNSVYSFAAVSLVLLLALALGAAVASLALRRARPEDVAAFAMVGAAAATAGGFWIFVYLTGDLGYVGMTSGLGEYLARIVALASAVAGPAALASGVALPALWGAWDHPESSSRPIGDLLAANTFGGIAGSLGAAFLALPWLGLRTSFLVAAALYLALSEVVAGRSAVRAAIAGALVAIAIADPMRAPIVHLRTRQETLRASYEGPSGIVSVVDGEGDLQLRLDNFYVLGGTASAANERRQGLLPLLLHRDPKRAAFIGLATGVTASAAPALGVPSTTAVELVPEVVAAARDRFAPWNGALLERDDVRVVVGDGRRFLAASDETFDVIVADLFVPWHAGAGSLYSREAFANARARLAAGGVFCQWLPLYQLTREEFEMVVATFLDVFPRASLWRDDFYADRPVVGLVGRLDSSPVDPEMMAERARALPEWATDPLLATPRGIAMLFAGDLAPAAALFSGSPINRDDRPTFEFLAPRLTRIGPSGDKDWFTGEPLADFYEQLAALDVPAEGTLPATEEVAEARRAGRALQRYAIAVARGDRPAAARLEAEVRERVPEVVAAAEVGGVSDPLLAAQRQLSNLREEQDLEKSHLEAMERRLLDLDVAREERGR